MTRCALFVSLICMGKIFGLLAVSAGLIACGDSGSNAGDDENEAGTLPSCAATCPGVLAAKCSHGPVDQADCVSGCETVRASACAPEYQALYDCGGTKPSYACDATGQVTLSGCEPKSAALYSCLAKQ
jgi:hypothetical protein